MNSLRFMPASSLLPCLELIRFDDDAL
jgi:hypothetical protein